MRPAEAAGPGHVTVRIDRTPDRVLSANSGKHKRTREPFIKIMRQTAALRTGETLMGQVWTWKGPIVIHVVIAWERSRPVRKRLDFDGAISISKSAIDGVFDKLDADDRQVQGAYLRQIRDHDGQGYMDITVVPMIDEAKEEVA